MKPANARDLVGEGLITVREACKFLGISRATCWKLMNRGELPYVHVGGVRRIPRLALHDFIVSNMFNAVR